MNGRVLVAYATKHGATKEIAEKIGQILRHGDLQIDVKCVGDVKDLNAYEAIVLGSAVYIGKWRKEAVKFLQEHEKALTERMVWLFSSGPTGTGDPVELADDWLFPPMLQPVVDRIQPQDIALFSGELNPEELNFIEKWMIRTVKAPVGDFRDWDGITAWATSISNVLSQNPITA